MTALIITALKVMFTVMLDINTINDINVTMKITMDANINKIPVCLLLP